MNDISRDINKTHFLKHIDIKNTDMHIGRLRKVASFRNIYSFIEIFIHERFVIVRRILVHFDIDEAIKNSKHRDTIDVLELIKEDFKEFGHKIPKTSDEYKKRYVGKKIDSDGIGCFNKTRVLKVKKKNLRKSNFKKKWNDTYNK